MEESVKKIYLNKNKQSKKSRERKNEKELLVNKNDIKTYVETLQNNETYSWLRSNTQTKENEKIQSIIDKIHQYKDDSKKMKKKLSYTVPKKHNQSSGKNKNKNDNVYKKVKSRKVVRKYKPHEIEQIVNTCKHYYSQKEYKKFHNILKRLTQNQCIQILMYKNAVSMYNINTPLPVVKFIVYLLLSSSCIKMKNEK